MVTIAASADATPGQAAPVAAITAADENPSDTPWTHCFRRLYRDSMSPK